MSSYCPVAIKAFAQGERPQERLERYGPEALTDAELLATLLRTGRPGVNILQVCQRLLSESGGLTGLLRYARCDFQAHTGIGEVKSLQLIAMMEMAKRVSQCGTETKPVLDSPEKVFRFMSPRMRGLEVEQFRVLCLNRKNRLIHDLPVTSGTATASLVHPREVFRGAIHRGATAIIAVHNHPSGDPSPSSADITVTRQLRKASDAIQIDFLDHIIIGEPAHDPGERGYYSFVEGGLLQGP